MRKPLAEMTNEELWELFPIIISEHDATWKDKYLSEKSLLEQVIGIDNIVRINHYGSTSVPDLPAKPTIDILLEIKDDAEIEILIAQLKSVGYIYSPQPDNPPPHAMFMKGYTPEGFKGQVYHLHVRYSGDWDELYFRDYLISHPDVADEYGKLKLKLKEEYEHDRDGYTLAKSDFIKKATKLGKKEFFHKYLPIKDRLVNK